MKALRVAAILLLGLSSIAVLPAQGITSAQTWLETSFRSFMESPRVLTLGWSKAGAWAALAALDVGARGGLGVRLIVLDAVEDILLYDGMLWSDEFETPEGDAPALVKAMVRSRIALDFLAGAERARIVWGKAGEWELRTFPFSFKDAYIGARADLTPVGAESGLHGERSFDFRLVAESSAKGEKKITSGRVDNAYEVLVDGFSLSPWEARIVVVFSVFRAGFEGDRSRTFGFSGCKLDSGFVKR